MIRQKNFTNIRYDVLKAFNIYIMVYDNFGFDEWSPTLQGSFLVEINEKKNIKYFYMIDFFYLQIQI
jgi:hypothetical protein